MKRFITHPITSIMGLITFAGLVYSVLVVDFLASFAYVLLTYMLLRGKDSWLADTAPAALRALMRLPAEQQPPSDNRPPDAEPPA